MGKYKKKKKKEKEEKKKKKKKKGRDKKGKGKKGKGKEKGKKKKSRRRMKEDAMHQEPAGAHIETMETEHDPNVHGEQPPWSSASGYPLSIVLLTVSIVAVSMVLLVGNIRG